MLHGPIKKVEYTNIAKAKVLPVINIMLQNNIIYLYIVGV